MQCLNQEADSYVYKTYIKVRNIAYCYSHDTTQERVTAFVFQMHFVHQH